MVTKVLHCIRIEATIVVAILECEVLGSSISSAYCYTLQAPRKALPSELAAPTEAEGEAELAVTPAASEAEATPVGQPQATRAASRGAQPSTTKADVEALSATVLWHNTYSPREVNMRIARASSMVMDFHGDASAKASLEATIDRVSSLSSIFRKIRNSSTMELRIGKDFEFDTHTCTHLQSLDATILKPFLACVVKKIPEDCVLVYGRSRCIVMLHAYEDREAPPWVVVTALAAAAVVALTAAAVDAVAAAVAAVVAVSIAFAVANVFD